MKIFFQFQWILKSLIMQNNQAIPFNKENFVEIFSMKFLHVPKYLKQALYLSPMIREPANTSP